MKEDIRKLILKYESQDLDFEELSNLLSPLIHAKLDRYQLDNYWRSQSLGEFIEELTISPIEDYDKIDDESALALLIEIVAHPESQAILMRNGEELEKRYGKPEGTISEYVFSQDMEPQDILKKLKEENIRLF